MLASLYSFLIPFSFSYLSLDSEDKSCSEENTPQQAILAPWILQNQKKEELTNALLTNQQSNLHDLNKVNDPSQQSRFFSTPNSSSMPNPPFPFDPSLYMHVSFPSESYI